jgi:hypothetical protein
MTPTQGEHAQTEALLHASYLESIFVSEEMSSARACRIAKELVRLHDENQRLHAQVAALTAALGVQAEPAATVIKKGADRQWMSERLGHLPDGIYSLYLAAPAQLAEGAANVQKPAEIEHVADNVSKIGAESNMGVAYAQLPDVDALAQEIRRVDGAHKLGAGALAEALMPFLRASHGQAPAAGNWQRYAKEGETAQQCIERHRTEHDALLSLLADARAHAPVAGAVAVPRETLVAWRQWCTQSMSHAIEHEISDYLSAAPTPAAQAERAPAWRRNAAQVGGGRQRAGGCGAAGLVGARWPDKHLCRH